MICTLCLTLGLLLRVKERETWWRAARDRGEERCVRVEVHYKGGAQGGPGRGRRYSQNVCNENRLLCSLHSDWHADSTKYTVMWDRNPNVPQSSAFLEAMKSICLSARTRWIFSYKMNGKRYERKRPSRLSRYRRSILLEISRWAWGRIAAPRGWNLNLWPAIHKDGVRCSICMSVKDSLRH
jgi:hypothetical protein